MIRLYDISSLIPYTSSHAQDHHYGGINQVRYSLDGKMFASASKDGSIKFWDGVTHRCIKYIPNAHSGSEVCSVQFSKNGKYLLSSGKDSTVRLWDLAKGSFLRSCYRSIAQALDPLTTSARLAGPHWRRLRCLQECN